MPAEDALGKQFRRRRGYGGGFGIYTVWGGMAGREEDADADADAGDAGYGDMGDAGGEGGGEGL
jgi:hypothetical protein